MAFYRSELKSLDFVDLDEESVSQIKKSNSFETIPMLTPKLPEAVFIRSPSPSDFNKITSCRELPLPNSKGKVVFDLTASCIEGRDCQIFCGELLEEDALVVGRKVAVKVYHSDYEAINGAEKEHKIAQMTQGKEGFVRAHYFDGAISVWDWMSLGSVDKCLQRRPSLDVEGIIVSIARSIQFLHQNQVVHHDIKPQNILITDSESASLIDFGDAKLNCPSTISVEAGIGLGTLAYTAPELLSKQNQVYNPYAADIYSFGVTSFYLLHRGRIDPWAAFFPTRAVQLILYVQKGFFAGGFNSGLPENHLFTKIISKCLALNPSERPSIDQVLANLTNK
jgi:hypothetical protein